MDIYRKLILNILTNLQEYPHDLHNEKQQKK